MKLSCTQENLNQGLNIVSHIAVKNNNLPILSNILIKAENKILTLSATNLEIGITANIRGKVDNDGQFTVDGKLLTNYIALLPKERVDLELENDELKINCNKQKTKIKGQNAADYPLIPKINKIKPYILSANDFKAAVSEVIFSAATSEIRPEISGVFMNFIDDNLILAATDSYRLAEKKLKLIENNKKIEGGERIIIPVKCLQEVSRILGVFKDDTALDNLENIEIYLIDNQIIFTYNGVDLISRLIEGQYPDYQQIIPENFKTKININTNELIKAVKTSSLFTKSGIYDIKVDFNNNKELIITSSSSQTGENISTLESNVSGEGGIIILNYRYLLDGLQSIDNNEEKIIMEINDSNSPCILRSEKDNNYLYLIMPIRQ